MKPSSKTIVCDIDGVLIEESKTFERSLAKPIQKEIDAINKLYDLGYTIILHTARSWSEYKMTVAQLASFNIDYHTLVCGKPVADYLIDDRAFPSVTKLLEIL